MVVLKSKANGPVGAEKTIAIVTSHLKSGEGTDKEERRHTQIKCMFANLQRVRNEDLKGIKLDALVFAGDLNTDPHDVEKQHTATVVPFIMEQEKEATWKDFGIKV